MTAPSTTTVPANLVSTMPAWAIRLVALAVAASGIVLDCWNPYGITSGMAKALVVVVALVVGAVIFSIHVFQAAHHEFGFTKAGVTAFETAELAELRSLAPDFIAAWNGGAKDAIAKLPDGLAAIDAATKGVAEVKGKVDAIPTADLEQLAGALRVFQAATAAPTSGSATPTVVSTSVSPAEPPPTNPAPTPAAP